VLPAASISKTIFLTEGHELEDERRFAALLKPGFTVFDIGANLGVYTLISASRIGPSGAVHAFEAEVSDPLLRRWGHTSRDVKQYLRQFGYRGYRTGQERLINGFSVSDEEPHPRGVNLLFIKEHHRALLPGDWMLPPAGD
jgi:hypothetical protein